MKKTLLLVAAAAAAMGVCAQTQWAFMTVKDADGANLFDGANPSEAGFVLAEDNNAVMSLTCEEPIKVFTPSRDPYSYAAVGADDLIKIEAGVTGSNNPKGQSMTEFPTSGMAYTITTKKSGVFTIFTKMNSNKNYWVLEGGSFAAYRLGVCNLSKAEGVIEYTLPVDEYDALNLDAADIDKYFNVAESGDVTGPKVPWAVVNPDGADMGEGTGFVQFLSFATEEYPVTFCVFAQGSKMAADGFVFTAMDAPSFADVPSVTFGGVEKTNDETGEVTPAPEPIKFEGKTYPVIGEGAGIDNIASDVKAAELDWNAPVYNVMGQKVSKNFKGIAIQNGAKFVVK